MTASTSLWTADGGQHPQLTKRMRGGKREQSTPVRMATVDIFAERARRNERRIRIPLSDADVEWCSERVRQMIRKGWHVVPAIDQALADRRALCDKLGTR